MKKILFLLLLGASAAWGLRTDQMTITGLSPNQCVQTDSNSKLTTTGSACGSGSAAAAFSATLANGLSSTLEIGAVGVWKAVGAISFTATYANGTPVGSTVTFSGWGSGLPMTSSFQGPTLNGEAVNYPAVAGTVVFTLSSVSTTTSASSTVTHIFYNNRFWGVSTVASGYTETNVEAFTSSELSNSKAKTFTVTAGAGEYLVWASPTRLGTVTFTVGGFEGGFNSPETVSITNPSGYTENYYVYSSVNSNLGTCNIVTQ